METRVRARDYEITPEVSAYLDERINSLAKLLGTDAELARFEIEVGKDAGRPRHGDNMWFAEIQVMYPGSDMLRATNHSASVNGAIDDAKEELERQIRRERKLSIGMMKRGGAMLKRIMRRGR